MNADSVMLRAFELGIILSVKSGGLAIKAPKGALSDELKAQIAANKAQIIERLLQSGDKQSVAIKPRARGVDIMPLSFAQRRLWFIDQLNQGSVEYNIPMAFRVRGAFDCRLGEKALQFIIERHESLRTVFVEQDNEPVQKVLAATPFTLSKVDLSEQSVEQAEAKVSELLKADRETPFDLSRDLMVRASYIVLPKGAEDDGVLLFNMHHIASDAQSMSILFGEFVRIYQALSQNQPVELTPLAIQYGDYALWQQKWLDGERLQSQLDYWKAKLADLPVVHSVPLDKVRPAVKGHRGAGVVGQVSLEVCQSLDALGQSLGMTPYMLFHGALALLLSRHANNHDIVLGTPVANREQAQLEPLIGFFVNNLVLRANTRQPSVRQYLEHIRAVNLEARANQDVPFEQLVEQAQIERTTAHTPIFQMLFTYIGSSVSAGNEGGLSGVSFSAIGGNDVSARYDLNVTARRSANGMSLSWVFDTELFNRQTIEAFNQQLICLFGALAESLDKPLKQLSMFDDATEKRLKLGLQGEVCALPHESFIAWFDKQCVQTPDSTAVSLGDVAFDYQTLNLKANRLADLLIEAGIEAGERVGIAMERSIEQLVSVLGVLKVGASYVPLSPEYPKARLSQMIEDSDVAQVLVSSTSAATVPLAGIDFVVIDECSDEDWLEGYSDDAPEVEVGTDSEAYVLYTSGSTGRPKGVMVPNRALVNYLCFAKANYMQGDVTGAVVSSPLYFDATLTSLLTPLCSGGEVKLLADDDGVLEQVYELLMGDKALLFKITPAHLEGLLQLKDSHNSHHIEHSIVVGGEALPPATLKRWQGILPNARFINEYGPTETVVGCSIYQANAEDDWSLGVPVGKPIQNTGLWLLDEDLNPVPQGSMGELYIGGLGVTNGYVGQSELTDERFIANPFGEGRLYRSGDLMRVMPDGQLQYCGRSDHQIKLRGYRIEPGEIAHVLNGCEGCNQALVMVKDELLVAYVAGSVTESALRQAAEQQLPSFMQPQVYVVLEVMPLTDNGKIDTKALPGIDGRSTQAVYQAPRNETEQQLVAIWAELLKLDSDKLSVDADFFALGGHSLLAVRLSAQIRAVFGKELSIKALFDTTTIAKQAEYLQTNDSRAERPPIVAGEVDLSQDLPLSFSQQRLWLLDKMNGGSVEYNMPAAINIHGPLDIKALELAIHRIIARHQVLRTVFVEQGEKAVAKVREQVKFKLDVVDLSDLTQQQQQIKLEQIISEDAKKPFDLRTDLMVRSCFIKLGAEQGVLCFTMHHIASDGWSMGVLLKELAAQYPAAKDNKPDPLTPLAVQYGDYAAWQKRWFTPALQQRQQDYWAKQLEGVAPVHSLPLDKPRTQRDVRQGKAVFGALDGQLANKLSALASHYKLTPFMLLQGALAQVLACHSNNHDIVLGAPVANRVQAGLEHNIGFFVNTLLVRLNTEQASMQDYWRHVREVNLDAQSNQDIPFEQLVDLAKVPRSPLYMPLFQIQFRMNTNEAETLDVEGLNFSSRGFADIAAKLDLNISAQLDENGVQLCWIYDTGLFDKARIETLNEHLLALLKAMAEQGDELSLAELNAAMLSAPEREQLLTELAQGKASEVEFSLLHQGAERQAVLNGEKVALRLGDAQLSYGELNAKANQAALALSERGVGQGYVVGICAPRSFEMIIAALAINKCGGAWVALDSSLPKARLDHIIADTQVSLVLEHQGLAEQLNLANGVSVVDINTLCDNTAPQQHNFTPATAIADDALAYVVYTSGSTGKPKGVMAHHQGVSNYLHYLAAQWQLGAQDNTLQLASMAFDSAVRDIFGPLSVGATVNLVESQMVKDTKAIGQLLVKQQITVLPAVVPSLLDALVRQFDAPSAPTLRLVLVSGEPLSGALCQKAIATFGTQLTLVNQYGPTECTMTSTFHQVSEDDLIQDVVAIGQPINNMRAFVLDEQLKLLPKGAVGQLYLAGPGLSLGYLNRDPGDGFVSVPSIDEPRLYATGDLAYRRGDGELVYMGRIDNQVKLRGFRVEPGEIEAQLLALEGVEQAACVLDNTTDSPQLVAYVCTESSSAESGGELVERLRAALSKNLPDYMIPSAFVQLEALPLTPNGKVDRKALASAGGNQLKAERREPSNEMEYAVRQIWAELLQQPSENIGVDDDFFAVGGHSLHAIMVVAEIRERFGIELAINEIFELTTVAKLADALSAKLTLQQAQAQQAQASIICEGEL